MLIYDKLKITDVSVLDRIDMSLDTNGVMISIDDSHIGLGLNAVVYYMDNPDRMVNGLTDCPIKLEYWKHIGILKSSIPIGEVIEYNPRKLYYFECRLLESVYCSNPKAYKTYLKMEKEITPATIWTKENLIQWSTKFSYMKLLYQFLITHYGEQDIFDMVIPDMGHSEWMYDRDSDMVIHIDPFLVPVKQYKRINYGNMGE